MREQSSLKHKKSTMFDGDGRNAHMVLRTMEHLVKQSMDRTGIGMVIAGLVLAAIGIYGVTLLPPEVVAFLIGLVELAVVIVGIGLIVIGAIMAKE
jgi:hypothetical protein